MMISPEMFREGLKDKSYMELIRERDRLIRFIRKFEKDEMAGDRSDPGWRICPAPDVQYQMYLEYLANLCRMMQEKYNEEYVWGERTLKQDAEEKKDKAEFRVEENSTARPVDC